MTGIHWPSRRHEASASHAWFSIWSPVKMQADSLVQGEDREPALHFSQKTLFFADPQIRDHRPQRTALPVSVGHSSNTKTKMRPSGLEVPRAWWPIFIGEMILRIPDGRPWYHPKGSNNAKGKEWGSRNCKHTHQYLLTRDSHASLGLPPSLTSPCESLVEPCTVSQILSSGYIIYSCTCLWLTYKYLFGSEGVFSMSITQLRSINTAKNSLHFNVLPEWDIPLEC